MGQVMTLCTSDEADDHGYDKTTVEKVRTRANEEGRKTEPLCQGLSPPRHRVEGAVGRLSKGRIWTIAAVRASTGIAWPCLPSCFFAAGPLTDHYFRALCTLVSRKRAKAKEEEGRQRPNSLFFLFLLWLLLLLQPKSVSRFWLSSSGGKTTLYFRAPIGAV